MQKTLALPEIKLTYTHKKSARARHVRVTVYRDASVLVTAPLFFADHKVEHFLRLKSRWIINKINYFKRLGQQIELPRGRRAYIKYKVQARAFVKNKIAELNRYYNFSFSHVAIKNNRTRWGSCSKQKNLNFNFRILFLPVALAEYIIVHELCHLAELNHSKNFWRLVSQSMPDFRHKIRALRAIF